MVILREICEEDTSNIVKWRNSIAVKSNLFTQTDLTEDMHMNWLNDYVKTGLCKQYIIVVKEGNSFTDIGTTFIKKIDYINQEGEFGIFIGNSNYRGKGYSFKATQLIIDIGFKKLGLKRIYLYVVADNIPAIKTYKKVGFCECGVDKEKFYRGIKAIDVIIMEIKS